MTATVRIFRYEAGHLYAGRPQLIKYLETHLNNIAVKTMDCYGSYVDSGMADDLLNERPAKIWIAWLSGRPVGWGMLTSRINFSAMQASVFVHPDFRQNGIGTRILKKMKRHAKSRSCPIVSQGWDVQGRKFYANNDIPYTSRWDHGKCDHEPVVAGIHFT